MVNNLECSLSKKCGNCPLGSHTYQETIKIKQDYVNKLFQDASINKQIDNMYFCYVEEVEYYMPVVQMREILKKCTKYANSYKWINKVNAMSDKQVMAVYFKMLRGGELK